MTELLLDASLYAPYYLGAAIALAAALIAGIIIFCVVVKKKNARILFREDLINTLSDNSDDVFLVLSGDKSRVEYVSSNAERILGVDADDAKKNVTAIGRAEYANGAKFELEDLNVVTLNGVAMYDESRIHKKTGERIYMRDTVYRTVLGGVEKFVIVLSDRTAEYKQQLVLKEAIDGAKAANESKSNFLANMSRDVRTPMNEIIGFTSLLSREAENPEKVREYAAKTAGSAQNLLQIINDVLDMSKFESGKTSLHVEDFSLAEFFNDIYAAIRPQIAAKRQRFEIRVKERLPERVVGDRPRLNQVLLNLLSNATKFTPERGNISLEVAPVQTENRGDVRLRIKVIDDGIGISKEFTQAVFEPFVREISVRTNRIPGTGLGLAITKSVLELMGGTIALDSDLGTGSTFTVEVVLPVSKQSDDDGEFWSAHGVGKILVVDEDEDFYRQANEQMGETGVAVDCAVSVTEAIVRIKEARKAKAPFNVVLIDCEMQKADGGEAVKLIKSAIGTASATVILTSYDKATAEAYMRKSGLSVFITKPFFIANLKSAIERASNKDGQDAEQDASTLLKGLKCLAAEDNDINAEILCELLAVEGAECVIAKNGKEALEIFEKSDKDDFDVIFMDVQMPVMNGYEATVAIRSCAHARAKTVPVIAMTANAFDDDVKEALDSGMNAHLSKPIDMDKLKETLKTVLKKG